MRTLALLLAGLTGLSSAAHSQEFSWPKELRGDNDGSWSQRGRAAASPPVTMMQPA